MKTFTSIETIDLSAIPTYEPEGIRENTSLKKETKEMAEALRAWQQKLYAESKQALLVVIQGMDASGKDSTVRHVFGTLNPQGVNVHSFKQPEASELARDFLWRVHKVVPAKGMIGIFNRSHYEDVLIGKVRSLYPPEMIDAFYEHIRNFEKLLLDTGTHIVKIFLHISKDEQEKRLTERMENPLKMWKYHESDWKERKLWKPYQKAYEKAFSETASTGAPWHIIPADDRNYRDYLISKLVLDKLIEMNPDFPPLKKTK
jgi:PPK2 family polyphosphate:nucleotide phosphotransferase